MPKRLGPKRLGAETSRDQNGLVPKRLVTRQQYFSGLGHPLTVSILLCGNPEESLAVNNAIFRRVQLYIMATKRFTS